VAGERPGGDECKRQVYFPVLTALQRAGAGAARDTYWRLHEAGTGDYTFDENQLNRLGYTLLAAQRTDDAIAMFELNAAAYPESWNPHDSLAEAYRAAGKRDQAIASYRRSLALNPDNANGARALAELEAEAKAAQ
jgi:tetratricopeptide (TPR) repeat protein